MHVEFNLIIPFQLNISPVRYFDPLESIMIDTENNLKKCILNNYSRS